MKRNVNLPLILLIAAICLVVLSSSAYFVSAGPVPTGKAINSKYITILQHSFRFDQSNYPYNVIGILANTNKNLNITGTYILGQLFDKDRKLITSSFGAPDFGTLRPGENSTFKLAFLARANETVDHYVIFPSGEPS